MSRLSSNYAGRSMTRSLDLFAFANLPPNRNTPFEMLMPRDGGRVVAGIEKAVQRWLKLLLTIRGTVFGDPSAGTEFIPSVMVNGGGNEEIEATFNAAAKDIDTYLRARYESDDTPLDEQIESAELMPGWEISNGRMRLSVRIITAAGVSAQIMVPVNSSFQH